MILQNILNTFPMVIINVRNLTCIDIIIKNIIE